MKKLNITTILFCLILFAINLSAQVPAYVPTNGLVGWWPFTGNANDLSGNGNNGTNNGAILTTDRFSNSNSAYNFDGLSNYIQTISSGPTGTGISVSYWFQSTQTVSPRTAIAWGGNGWGTIFEIIHNYGMPSCLGAAIHGGGTHFDPGATSNPQNGNWHHYIVILPSNANAYNQTIFYLDGIQIIGSCLWNNYGAPPPNIGNINPIKFGKDWGGTGSIFFDGKLDDIGVWNRALTSCEINKLYTASTISAISVVASNSLICAGQNATISASGANSYTWSNSTNSSSIVVSPSLTSTYSVAGTTSASCTSTSAITLSVNPNPTITVNNGTICAGQNFTISPNGANTYTILGAVLSPTGNTSYTVAGTSTAVVSPSSNASFTVAGTSTAGCVSQAVATSSLTVNLCVGINNQNMGLGGVSIYPNPTNGEFTIELVSLNNTYITITNVLGQIIKTQKAELINQIDLNLFEKGVYFINVMENNQSVYRGSIIKQ